MDQHRRSPLSQATVQCSSESSGDLVLIGSLGFSTQLRGLPVPDAGISGNGWNSPPFLSMTQQHGNGFYPPTVGQVSLLFTWACRRPLNILTPAQVDAILNMYNLLLGHSPNHHPTLSPSDEVRTTCVLMILSNVITMSGSQTSVADGLQRPFTAPCPVPDVFPGSQTRVKVPDDQLAVQVDSMADRALRNLFPRFDTDTPKSCELVVTTNASCIPWLIKLGILGVAPPLTDDQMMNQTRAITGVVAYSSDHEHFMTEETQIPMLPFGAKPLPDDCSSSPTSFKCSTSGATRLCTMPQDANQASRTHNKDEHRGAPRRHTCSFIHDMLSDKQLIWTW